MNITDTICLRASAFILFAACLTGCSEYLDIKPDQKMVVPSNLQDCDALLDNRLAMNNAYPVAGETAADHYYISDNNFAAIGQIGDKNAYIWDPNTDISLANWQNPYKVVQVAGQILDVLNELPREQNIADYDRIKGSALFYRGYALLQLADVFTLPYREGIASATDGLALRVKPEVDYESVRADLKETYLRIQQDLTEAIALLPVSGSYKTRPTKPAALGALARLGLVTSDFPLAEEAAREALSYGLELIDYNALNPLSYAPFAQFNKEVVFHAVTLSSATLNNTVSKVDTLLYSLYDEDDLRKTLYFGKNTDGSCFFKGKYDGELNSTAFAGITVDELYLTLAEALVRNNRLSEAEATFNEFMEKRWKNGRYLPKVFVVQSAALRTILEERRKSLILRNVRWMDLKRLNLEPDNATVLVRKLIGTTYELRPNDLRYAFLIPVAVMGYAPKIEQNKR